MNNQKITERDMLGRLRPGAVLLAPLIIRSSEEEVRREKKHVDAVIDVVLPGEDHLFRFVVEAKSRTTREAVHAAVAQAKGAVGANEWPMIQVPYLAPDLLEELQRLGMSGIDLCGNGVVVVPNRLYVVRSGQPNRYRESRPLHNPYRGRSGLVARTLLDKPYWPTLSKMVEWINDAGAELSLAQASKAVRALEEELIVSKVRAAISLQDPMRLLDKLGSEWRKPTFSAWKALRLTNDDTTWPSRLSSHATLRWALTGESSASRYIVFSQGGPRRIAVSDLLYAASVLDGVPEAVPNLADIYLLETDEPGFFFDTTTDEMGMRWASRLQSWLELQAGDPRQQATARDLRRQLLREWGSDQ